MAPLPPVPNVLRADIHWTIGADLRGMNRTHWVYTGGPPSTADCIALAGLFRTACTAWDGLATAANAMTSFVITDLASSSGAQGVNSTVIACTRAGTAPSGNVCVAVELLIARRYRGGKPKMFVPLGAVADFATSQTWVPSFLASVNSNAAAFGTSFIGESAGSTVISHQCSVSYFQGYMPPTTGPSGRVKQALKLRTGGPVVDTVVGYNATARIGSQRKRLSR